MPGLDTIRSAISHEMWCQKLGTDMIHFTIGVRSRSILFDCQETYFKHFNMKIPLTDSYPHIRDMFCNPNEGTCHRSGIGVLVRGHMSILNTQTRADYRFMSFWLDAAYAINGMVLT